MLLRVHRWRRHPTPIRCCTVTRPISIVILLLGTGLGAGPATARAAADPEAWRGLYCARPGCDAAPASPIHTAGFGAALVGAAWIARRRVYHRD